MKSSPACKFGESLCIVYDNVDGKMSGDHPIAESLLDVSPLLMAMYELLTLDMAIIMRKRHGTSDPDKKDRNLCLLFVGFFFI
nr:hypothetical protein [Candidatus Sigynarchaeum springense]